LALEGAEETSSLPEHFTTGEKSTATHFFRDLGGPRGRSGRFAEEENLLPVLKIETQFLGRPSYTFY